MLERRAPDTTLEEKLYKQERPAMHVEDVPWVEPYISGEEGAADEPQTQDDGGEVGVGENDPRQ